MKIYIYYKEKIVFELDNRLFSSELNKTKFIEHDKKKDLERTLDDFKENQKDRVKNKIRLLQQPIIINQFENGTKYAYPQNIIVQIELISFQTLDYKV